VNKADLAGEDHLETIKNEVITSDSTSLVVMSANRKDDYMVLKKALASASGLDRINETRVMITNARHYEALMKVSEATGRVVKGLETGLQSDLIAIDVRQAIHYLGEITGAITTDEILGNIFRNFCIGK
jgi:tRNA modification GTPase